MSDKMKGDVWELDLDPIDKLVLMAMVDQANQDRKSVV